MQQATMLVSQAFVAAVDFHIKSELDQAEFYYSAIENTNTNYAFVATYLKAVLLQDKQNSADLFTMLSNLGDALREVIEYPNAILVYRMIINSNMAQAETYYKLGLTLECNMNYAEADVAFKQAIALDSNHVGVCRKLVWFDQAVKAHQYPLRIEQEDIPSNRIFSERSDSAPFRISLVTYASAHLLPKQMRVHKSAIEYGGIDEAVGWTRSDIVKTRFYKNYQDIFDQERGGGYWLWRPFIILQQMYHINYGDYVMCYDVGRYGDSNLFTQSVLPIIRWCEEENNGMYLGVYSPEAGPLGGATKRDCFVYMGCDRPRHWNHSQISVNVMFYKKCASSIAFLKRYLHYMTDPRISTYVSSVCNLPEMPWFKQHGSEQSVITNMVLKEGLKLINSPGDFSYSARNVNFAIQLALEYWEERGVYMNNAVPGAAPRFPPRSECA